MYLGFVHYRFIGATLVSLAFVMPSFLMVVAIGKLNIEALRKSWILWSFFLIAASATIITQTEQVLLFVDGITAAVIGALVGAVVVIGIRSITDIPTAIIAITTLFTLIYIRKIQEPNIILVAAITGLILKTVLI